MEYILQGATGENPTGMSQVDEVRAAADIVKIVGDYVKLRKAGANFMGLCPFHGEKTPSFAVHPIKQIFHCFGCGVGGDVFKFVMLLENLTFPEALRRVAEKVGVTLRERVEDATFDAAAKDRATLYRIHEVAIKFFQMALTGSAEGRAARAYLADRGMRDDAIARFRIGFAPSDGQALTRHLAEAGFDAPSVEKSGLVLRNQESGNRFDRFRRRVIFPIANESGKVVAFGGRALGDDQPKYLNSPETLIYTKGRVLYNLDKAGQAIRKQEQAVLVEGYMDCISVASAGVDHVVATCGTSLTEGQIRLLARFARRVVVNYDPDTAGRAATERSLTLLLEEGLEAKVLALPEGLDPDAFIKTEGAAAYKGRLAAAPSYIDYLTERTVAQHPLDTPEGRAAVAKALIPVLAKVSDRILRGLLTENLLARIQLFDPILRREVLRSVGLGQPEPSYRDRQVTTVSKVTPAERKLLQAMLESAELADELQPRLLIESLMAGLTTESIFKRLLEERARGEKIDPVTFGQGLAAEDQKILFELVMDMGEPPVRGEVLGCVQALKKRQVERQGEKVQLQIQAAERQKDTATLAQLLREKAILAKELAELSRTAKNSGQNKTK
jgi:DNA primase